MNLTVTDYPIIRNRPVARFRYKGSHTKPVRREVFVTEIRRDVITGYETLSGRMACDLDAANLKSFTRDKIFDLERLSLKSAGMSD
jgi:hypothetical protein